MSCCVFTTFVINTIYLLVSLHNLIFNNGCINNLGSKKYLMILIISPLLLLIVIRLVINGVLVLLMVMM